MPRRHAPISLRRITVTLSTALVLAAAVVSSSSAESMPSHDYGPTYTTTSGQAYATTGGQAHSTTSGQNVMLTSKAVAFHDAMRSLWQVHGTFTERAIVAAVADLPETTAVVARLQRNQVEIGNAVKPYYGAAAGKALTNLLHQHISDAVAAVLAARSGDRTKLTAAEKAFYANGNQIASFLHRANPQYWSLSAMQSMMKTHLNQVLALAVDQLKGNYAAAITLYGAYIDHLQVGMADMLSSGIIKQFPNRF